MVGITICIVIRLQESVVACVLQPWSGGKDPDRYTKCPKCEEVWGVKVYVEPNPSHNAVLVDARLYLAFWRRKIFWRMAPPFHSWVVWTTQPHVPIEAFEAIFAEDWENDAYKTSSVVTVIKVLETTRAVEDFCRFETIQEDKGWGSGKLLASGEVLVLIPPVQVVHTESKLAGSRVSFTYGWVLLTTKGTIRWAESMEVPAQGWEHVEARVRDIAVHMKTRHLDILYELVSISEAKLLALHAGNTGECAKARAEREADTAHYILPRPKKDAKALALPAQLPSTLDCGEVYGEYNPYEAFKHGRHGDPGAGGSGQSE
jgi:hypothetical protein